MRLARCLWLAAAACAFTACAWRAHRPAWEEPPPPPREAPVVEAGHFTRAELDNGLRVFVLEDRRLPRVVLGVTLRRGEAMVDLDHAGLAPFTAELMQRGAGERDALEFAETIDSLGASFSVSAGWDSMTVQISGLTRDLDTLLGILADVVLRPRFEPREAKKVRAETLAALETAKDSPQTLLGWYVARTLFHGHRFGVPLSGDPSAVAKLDAAAARRFYERVFLPDDAVLSASGDVSIDAFLARAGGAFGAWQPGGVPAAGDPTPRKTPVARRVVVVDRPDLVQAQIAVAHEGISRTDPGRIAASLMNLVLGGAGFSSRLMKRVRAEEGLTYSVSSGFNLRREPAAFVVFTFTRVSEVRTVVDQILSELERMRAEPPSEGELSEARTLAVGRFSLGLETSAAVMGGLVDLDVYGLPEDSLDTYRQRVRAVTREDTARMARELLHPDRAAIVAVGPAEQIASQLDDLGPVEIVTP